MKERVKFLIWVTSDCNMSCPLCNQAHTMRTHKGYQMSMKEVFGIVESCKKRGIHFEDIELIGGEPTLWINLKEGVKELKKITDHIFFVTNGTNPEIPPASGVDRWVVSISQVTRENKKVFAKYGTSKMKFTGHYHKKVPDKPLDGVLPADCVASRCTFPPHQPENNIVYLKGKMYYCNLVVGLSDRLPIEEDTVCDFEDDFLSFFKDKKFDKEMCRYCLCNHKVWKLLPS